MTMLSTEIVVGCSEKYRFNFEKPAIKKEGIKSILWIYAPNGEPQFYVELSEDDIYAFYMALRSMD